jgi:hypothetical protein
LFELCFGSRLWQSPGTALALEQQRPVEVAMEEKHYSRVHMHAAAGDGEWFDERRVGILNFHKTSK